MTGKAKGVVTVKLFLRKLLIVTSTGLLTIVSGGGRGAVQGDHIFSITRSGSENGRGLRAIGKPFLLPEKQVHGDSHL